MINSRNLNDLEPDVAKLAQLLIDRCKLVNIDLLVTSTFRDGESQDALYAQGRTKPGSKVTNAKAGQSAHNYRVAFDVVPLVNGKAIWNDFYLWRKIGSIGVELGLDWGGNFTFFTDYPHFQKKNWTVPKK